MILVEKLKPHPQLERNLVTLGIWRFTSWHEAIAHLEMDSGERIDESRRSRFMTIETGIVMTADFQYCIWNEGVWPTRLLENRRPANFQGARI